MLCKFNFQKPIFETTLLLPIQFERLKCEVFSFQFWGEFCRMLFAHFCQQQLNWIKFVLKIWSFICVRIQWLKVHFRFRDGSQTIAICFNLSIGDSEALHHIQFKRESTFLITSHFVTRWVSIFRVKLLKIIRLFKSCRRH